MNANSKMIRDTFDADEINELVSEIRGGSDDVEIGNYRVISDAVIDEVLFDELKRDPYILGCFSAWALSDATGWPMSLIEAAQKGEQFEEIGNGLTDDHIRELAQILVSNDGYGHHFSSYDGSEEEITLYKQFYHVFRTN